MTEPGVTFRDVTKLFGDVRAVSDLTFEIDEGEFLVLVGPSGCGKTTALRMVAGLEEPTSGEIAIGGQVVNGVQPRDRDIAMVFQSYALYPHMSVHDNLAFGLRQRKTSKEEIATRVTEASEMLGISGLLARKPKELSGGQRQRVALGRAIVRRPKVFLMDEPLSNLDAHLRLRTRGEIAALHRRLQTTFVYVTHDQVEAMTMGTRIAVMREGVLQQLDTPQRLYDHPLNTFVATFIGSPAMNLIDGEVVRVGEVLTHSSAICTVSLPSTAAQPQSIRVVLGIRPEQFERTPVRKGTPGALTGMVTLVEPLGSDLFVTLDCDSTAITARLDPETNARVGDYLTLRPAALTAHLFDASDGQRIR
jgi:multiple sugar transport system ATP-binding protein